MSKRNRFAWLEIGKRKKKTKKEEPVNRKVEPELTLAEMPIELESELKKKKQLKKSAEEFKIVHDKHEQVHIDTLDKIDTNSSENAKIEKVRKGKRYQALLWLQKQKELRKIKRERLNNQEKHHPIVKIIFGVVLVGGAFVLLYSYIRFGIFRFGRRGGFLDSIIFSFVSILIIYFVRNRRMP